MKIEFFEKIRLLISKDKKKEKIKIGLDWGFSSLKAVVLEFQDGVYLLKDARIVQLPSQDLKLSPLIKDLNLPAGGVNLGICGPNVIVRYVSMAKMSIEEFRNSLRYEAASHLPFPVEEVNLDGVILKDLPDNQMLVMLAAARKDFINERLKVFRDAGVKVNILDIDSLALINAFNYTCAKLEEVSSGAVALLNIGASVTNINVLESGVPHFSRDINVAGKDLGRQTSREVAVSNFVTEIRKSFDYYEAGSTAVINKIFLSGGGSLVSDLAKNLEGYLGVKIEQWDPFDNFEFAAELNEQDLRKSSAQFAVAVGLALR
ncbi:MAG: pilus assembly protein PilM [Candidatus Omnitrophota bacterium]